MKSQRFVCTGVSLTEVTGATFQRDLKLGHQDKKEMCDLCTFLTGRSPQLLKICMGGKLLTEDRGQGCCKVRVFLTNCSWPPVILKSRAKSPLVSPLSLPIYGVAGMISQMLLLCTIQRLLRLYTLHSVLYPWKFPICSPQRQGQITHQDSLSSKASHWFSPSLGPHLCILSSVISRQYLQMLPEHFSWNKWTWTLSHEVTLKCHSIFNPRS